MPDIGVAGRGKLVLLAEDDPHLRYVIEQVLVRHGFRVIAVPDGTLALQVITSGAEQTNVVLSDVEMPRMTGAELLAEMRRRHNLVPVLLMSGRFRSLDEFVEPVHRGGAAFIRKPFSQESLVTTIEQLTQGGESEMSHDAPRSSAPETDERIRTRPGFHALVDEIKTRFHTR